MSNTPLKTPRGLIQLRQQQTPQRKLDMSITLTKDELQYMLDKEGRNSSFMHTTGAGSVMLDNISLSERLAVDERSSVNNVANMFKNNADMLFPQFLEVLQGRTNDSEVFDTIQDIIQTCAGVLEETQKQLQRRLGMALTENYASRSGATAQAHSAWLDEELKTWKLLYALYKDRILLQADGGMSKAMEDDMPPLGGSEKEVIQQLYVCNSTLREYQLIVDWLEACYDNKDNGPHIAQTTDGMVGWENTLFQLQQQKVITFGSGAEIVKSLDPDAVVREKRPLHALDEEDNARLSKCIFNEIRQGRIDEAMALCKYCGHTWRAALLEGWRLHEDPNYDETQQQRNNEKMPIEGNPRRDIWKKCAWMMADSKKFDEYTRAIAGAFCGHLESLKSLLNNSWEDLLWSYLKVQIDIRVESEIRSCCMKPYHPMPEAYWNSKMSLEQIFDELSVHNDAAVRDYAHSKVAIIQKYLIMDNIGDLLQQMRCWVDDACADEGTGNESQPMSPHMLRFLTHIVLFMRQIGRVDKEETADRIIAAYVECLIAFGDAQLVAFYTAALPSKLQVLLYSKFLEGITETAARASALEEAIKAGLDIEKITRHTVETIRQRLPNDTENLAEPSGKPQVGDITAFDMQKIKALEWLSFLPAQRGELIWQANALIRYYMGEGNTECVRAAYEMVPADSLSQIINIYGSKDNFPCREECSIKEYLSYKIYLTAIDSFNEWSLLYHNRPKEPQLVNSNANFTERVASEHKEQVYRAELNRWKLGLEEQLKVTRDALYNVLLFPDKGWLIDPDTPKDPVDISEIDWENRQIQMEKLRSICIPEIVLLLHKVLHLSGDFTGCVKLGDEIAAESRQLYRVYTKHKLAELMAKLAESSLELLNNKLDPWGFAVTA